MKARVLCCFLEHLMTVYNASTFIAELFSFPLVSKYHSSFATSGFSRFAAFATRDLNAIRKLTRREKFIFISCA